MMRKMIIYGICIPVLAMMTLAPHARGSAGEEVIYTALSLSEPTDSYFGEQWALYNDGTFAMPGGYNRFPVYDDPFGTPYGPGEWMLPGIGVPGAGGGIHIIIRFDSLPPTSRQEDMRPDEGMPEALYGPGDMISTDGGAVAGVDIGLKQALTAYNGGVRDVVVALIDTGFDYTHEDLGGVIWVNDDEIPANGVDDDHNGYVDDIYGWNFYHGTNEVYVGGEDSHGTHGAGTIAARYDNALGIAGIAGNDHVRIMALKALGGHDGAGTTSGVVEAIKYAEANGATICNLSFGSYLGDDRVYEAIASSDMLFVIAAGNDGADNDLTPCYPASYDLDNIISVANLMPDGTLHYSSNYGCESVDIAAPGTYILSTTAGDGYSYMSGTSMAAPMVTGAAALCYTHFGDASIGEIKEILLKSARPLSALAGKTFTGGMLDVGEAIAFDLSSIR